MAQVLVKLASGKEVLDKTSDVTLTGDVTGLSSAGVVGKIKGVPLGTVANTDGHVLVGDGTYIGSETPDSAGIVDKTSDQTIGGNKTFTGDIIGDIIEASEVEADIHLENFRHAKHDFAEKAASLASTSYAPLYAGAGTNGTQAIVASLEGKMRLDTSATGSSTSTLTSEYLLSSGKDLILRMIVKTDLLTNREMKVGLYKDASNYLLFDFDSAVDGNIHVISNSAGAGEIDTDSGVALVADTYIVVEIVVDGSDQSFTVSIDDTAVDCSGEAHVLPNLDDWKSYVYIDNKDQAQSNKCDVDLIEYWNER